MNTHTHPSSRSALTRFAWLSIAAAVATIVLKAVAYLVTGSVGLLSDALESIVNLAGALMALAMLSVAAQPADEDHTYGHSKAEYFSSGAEGFLIVVAALGIAITAVQRLINPQPIEQIGTGMLVSFAASAINLVVALVLRQQGKKHNSITLQANSAHLLTDVWTSVGVLAGVGLVAITGWQRLDPVIALVVAGNIIWAGYQILRESVHGLMDSSIPADELAMVNGVLNAYLHTGVQYHELRTRRSGAERFISFHLLAPGDWSVHKGHALADEIEHGIRAVLPGCTIFSHLESLEDPASWEEGTLKAIPNNITTGGANPANANTIAGNPLPKP